MNTIIVTKMNTGMYLVQEDALGGEIINFFKTDRGEHYIFAGAEGVIGKDLDNTVCYVVMTGPAKSNRAEVFGVAKIEKQIVVGGDKTNKQVEEYMKKTQVTYGGVNLMDIHKVHADKIYGSVLTFKAKEVLVPKNRLFIAAHGSNQEDDDIELSEYKTLGHDHICVKDNDHAQSFCALQKAIDNESLWDKGRLHKIDLEEKIDRKFNFLKIIGKEYSELAFSNMLAYFLSEKRNILQDFCDQVLGVNIDKNAKIIRESKNNIDLWIEDSEHIIVIENKIKSDINGKEQMQLQKYYDFAEKEIKTSGKDAHYFVFVPNYSRIKKREDLQLYKGGENYDLIKYKQLYDFFSERNVKFDDWRDDKRYYEDFCNALYLHSQDKDESYYINTKIEFIKRINKVKALRKSANM